MKIARRCLLGALLCVRLGMAACFADAGLRFADAADMAIGASADLRNEYAQAGIRERAWVLGRREFFPKLTLTAGEDDRLSLISTDSFTKTYSVSVEQTVFDGGKLRLSRRLSRAEMAMQVKAIAREATEIGEAAVSAYRQVLSARAVLHIREASLTSLEEQRRILALEADLGLALPADLSQADLTVADARIEILSLKVDLAEAEQEFAGLIGLDTLPFLAEAIDIRREAVFPQPEIVREMALERNPDLMLARHSIDQKQEQLKLASRSWIPTLNLTGSWTLSGQQYPLTRHNWSVGISIDFSSPFLANSAKAVLGGEPPYDKTAQIQNSFTPLPNPAASMDIKSARMSLALEKSKYGIAFERLGRQVINALEKLKLVEKRRSLAVSAVEIAQEQLRLNEIRFNLGKITRIDLMASQNSCAEKEVAAVQAAVSLLEAERELEKMIGNK